MNGDMPQPLTLIPLTGLPEVQRGDVVADLIALSLNAQALSVHAGDIIVIAQKIVSKAEGRLVQLVDVVPSAEAHRLAAITLKPPALVELVLRESTEVMRAKPNVLIVRHRIGLVMANAGIDQSNVPHDAGAVALLLPEDPDASAAALATDLSQRLGTPLGVIIADSFGRAWRTGTVNVAIGVAGLAALVDRRGELDRDGRALRVTEVAHADALAAAAGIVMGEGAESCPAVLVRGAPPFSAYGCAADLVRSRALDMFP
jgi:coenzyme F420-0:L-glutamate ligase/coenzyme F420-1:gamma-L-glutamate ligase